MARCGRRVRVLRRASHGDGVSGRPLPGGAKTKQQHWQIDNYKLEGIRHTQWFTDDVIKYHRSVETYVNTLIDKGFTIVRLLEPEATADEIRKRPDLREESRRPTFMLTLGASVVRLAVLRRAGG